jgi:hypothetical protein
LLPGGFQNQFEQSQYVAVLHPLRHFRQQNIVPDRIKVGAKIQIDDARLSLTDRCLHPEHRFLRRPLRTIAVRTRLKIGFEDRLQDELQRPLDHAVADRRNRKHADLLAPVLRDLLLPHRQRPIPELH